MIGIVESVYGLCALTSLACAVLLLRGYLRSRARLLLWSALCFAGLFIDNVVVIADEILLPTVPLFGLRVIGGLLGVACLLYGMILDSE